MKTGDPISPPGGYKGGGMQMLVDVSIDPAGTSGCPTTGRIPLLATASPMRVFRPVVGGQGMTLFYGIAKPVRSRQIGPARGF
jgi:hypothetical protein